MPADAYVQDADMKKVADAIRTKGKTSAPLVFPDGMANAINELGEGYEVDISRIGTQLKGAVPDISVDIVTGKIRNPATNFTVIPPIWATAGLQTVTADINGVQGTATVNVEDLISKGTFGVRINISNSSPNNAVEYIDDAVGFIPMTRKDPGSWANIQFVKNIKPVLRKSDGTWHDLDKRNLAKGADITTIGNDLFTRFPTWWLSISTDGSYGYIRFCDHKKDNTYFKLASLYNGIDQGMFHMGCFHAHNSGNQTYSSANKLPTGNVSTEGFRISCQARGAGFDQVGWYQIMYLQALFILLFKGRNGQELIGRGYTGASSMTTENRTIYDNDYGMAGSSSGTDQMSFFWINNWWGNVYDFVGGVKTDGSRKLMTLDNGQPINTSGSGWVTQNSSPGDDYGGYITQMDMKSTKTGFFPTSDRGSNNSEHWCDNGYVRASRFPNFGGSYNDGDDAGPFRLAFNFPASNTYSNVGSRLCYRLKVES